MTPPERRTPAGNKRARALAFCSFALPCIASLCIASLCIASFGAVSCGRTDAYDTNDGGTTIAATVTPGNVTITPIAPAEPMPLHATIVRDATGVPHIFGPNRNAVMRGLGFAHARDRLFQMDFSRRFLEGRLLEFFWEDPGVPPDPTVEANNDWVQQHDEKYRTLGFALHNEAVLEAFSLSIRSLLEAYAAGVNDFLASAQFELPAIYTDVLNLPSDYEIEQWAAVDCLNVWDRVSNQFDANNVFREVKNLDDFLNLGYIDCICPDPQPIDDAGAVIQEPPVGMWQTICTQVQPLPLDPRRGHIGEIEFKASHGFVLAADRTTVEGPLVFADPKIQVSAPNFFYPAHIATTVDAEGAANLNDVNVQGIGFAGCPGMVVFANPYVAQTVTGAAGDTWDLFEIDVVPCNGPDTGNDEFLCYRYQDPDSLGGPPNIIVAPIEERTELILTKPGGPTIEHTVRTTHIGPIINELLVDLWIAKCPGEPVPSFLTAGDPQERLFALEHLESSQTNSHSLVASMRAMLSRTMNEYLQALDSWIAPATHILFAVVDRGTPASEGRIGYVYGGGIPCRATKSVVACAANGEAADLRGRFPYDGFLAAEAWGPKLPALERPRVIDPPQGYVFAGNNIAAGQWFQDAIYYGEKGAGDTYRSLTLRYKLGQHFVAQGAPAMTLEQAWDLHADASSVPTGIYRSILNQLEVLDTGGQFIAPPNPPEGPAITDAEKAWKIMNALQCWNGADFEQSSPHWPLVNEILIGMVRESRYDFVPGSVSSNFSCSWNEGEGGVCHFLKAFRSNLAILQLFENDGVTLTTEAGWTLEVAIAAWDQLKLQGLPDDPCQWPPGVVEDFAVPYQANLFCPKAGIGSCPLADLPPQQQILASLDKRFVSTLNSAESSSFPALMYFDPTMNMRAYFPVGLSEDPESMLYINPTVKLLWEADSRCDLTLNGPIKLPVAPQAPEEVLENSIFDVVDPNGLPDRSGGTSNNGPTNPLTDEPDSSFDPGNHP